MLLIGASLVLGIMAPSALSAAPPVKLNGPMVLGGSVHPGTGAFQFSPDGQHVLYLADQMVLLA
jgi:hypothetical protein